MKNLIILLFLFLVPQITIAQPYRFLDGQTVFGTPVEPEPSAIFQVESTEHGFLPPRLTNAQRDALETTYTTLPIGLQIYNTEEFGIQVWNGSGWVGFLGGVTGFGTQGCLAAWAADATPELEDSQFCVINDNELRIVTGTPLVDTNMVLGAQAAGVIQLDSLTEANSGLDVNGKFTVTSTTDASTPCPTMTEVQRDALTPATGECVYNSTTLELNVYNGVEWVLVGGGGLDKWAASEDYEIDDVVWLADDNHIYVATTAHTSGATFNAANWDELSDSDDRLEKFPAETTDNKVVRTDVNGNTVQGSLVEIDDLGAMSGLTDLTVDNLNLNGNTLSSTSGDLIVNSFANLKFDGIIDNQVVFANNTDNIVGSTNFLYAESLDKLRVSGIDFESAALAPYTAGSNLGIAANGTGVVNITSETNVENLNISGSSITGTDPLEDLTITAEATRNVQVENVIVEDNTISSVTATPLEITAEATQPVNVEDVDIQDNAVSASVLNDDLELAGNGTGRVKVDRGGTLYEAGSRNPEYVELIDDPSFQAGVSEWSCTNATVAQVTNASPSSLDHGVDRSTTAAKITVTADGGYCEIVKTIGTSQAGTYVPSIYYASSSANAFIEFARDSRARVVDGLDFINSGDYEFLSAQLIASTGLSVRLGGNNTDVIHADMASFELGGYNRSASKNCSGVLDCENDLSGHYDSSEATVNDSIKDQTPETFVTGVTKSATNNAQKAITVQSGIFSTVPKCVTSGSETSATNATYDRSSSTATSLVFLTRNINESLEDTDFDFECTKAPADYKTTEDQGVTIIPDNKDARLVVTNEGTTANQAVGNATVTVNYDTVKESQYIEWDTINNEGTFQASGTYRIVPNAFISNVSASASFELFVETDDGTGYAQASNTPKWGVSTNSTDANRAPLSNPFQVKAEKGDKFRIRVTSSNASSNIENTAGFYPTLDVTPLGGGKAVVENNGVPTYSGEGPMIAGYASFGGGTDGSVCDIATCNRYGGFGDLAQNISVTRTATGDFEISVSGLKPNSPITCSVPLWSAAAAGVQISQTPGEAPFVTNASGEYTFGRNFRASTTDSLTDVYLQVKCEGPRP